MIDTLPQQLERARITEGDMASAPGSGVTGAYEILYGLHGVKLPDGSRPTLQVIAHDGQGRGASGWEHVSVTDAYAARTPTWDEVCAVKDLFWPPEERAVQYHPTAAERVNLHPHVLHLWRPQDAPIPAPPRALVG